MNRSKKSADIFADEYKFKFFKFCKRCLEEKKLKTC